jgi:hypothetical protein
MNPVSGQKIEGIFWTSIDRPSLQYEGSAPHTGDLIANLGKPKITAFIRVPNYIDTIEVLSRSKVSKLSRIRVGPRTSVDNGQNWHFA